MHIKLADTDNEITACLPGSRLWRLRKIAARCTWIPGSSARVSTDSMNGKAWR